MNRSYLIAGFGGQGLLFAGKFLAHKAMIECKEVTWLPAYGPEKRGGTANCSVIVSDEPVGSPIVDNPDVLVVMNLPSLNRFEETVVPGGTIFVDSSMIDRKVERTDVKAVYIPATRLAGENGNTTLANMVLMGAVLRMFGEYDESSVDAALSAVVPQSHPELFEANRKSLETGRDFS